MDKAGGKGYIRLGARDKSRAKSGRVVMKYISRGITARHKRYFTNVSNSVRVFRVRISWYRSTAHMTVSFRLTTKLSTECGLFVL